jgi:hypothetical protein
MARPVASQVRYDPVRYKHGCKAAMFISKFSKIPNTVTKKPILQHKNNRSESVTFRLDSEKLQKLRGESQENQISLNTLVNQVIASFVDWDMVVSKAGWELLPKDILKELFGAIDEETLKKIASKTADTSKDARLMLTGVDDIESFYATMRYRIKKSGFVLREYDDPDGSKRIVVQHEMGLNWSMFFKEYNERILNSFGYKADIEISINSVMMKISK